MLKFMIESSIHGTHAPAIILSIPRPPCGFDCSRWLLERFGMKCISRRDFSSLSISCIMHLLAIHASKIEADITIKVSGNNKNSFECKCCQAINAPITKAQQSDCWSVWIENQCKISITKAESMVLRQLHFNKNRRKRFWMFNVFQRKRWLRVEWKHSGSLILSLITVCGLKAQQENYPICSSGRALMAMLIGLEMNRSRFRRLYGLTEKSASESFKNFNELEMFWSYFSL